MLESHAYIKYYQPYCGTVYQKFRAGEKKRRKKKRGKKKVDRVDEECDSDWQVERRESCESRCSKTNPGKGVVLFRVSGRGCREL